MNKACPVLQTNPMNLLFNSTAEILCFESVKEQPFVYQSAELSPHRRALYQFYIINPVKPGATSWQAESIAAVYNFLLESDVISVSRMLRFLNSDYCTLKPRTATYSGGKSIHCIYSLAAPIAKEDYRAAFYALQRELTSQYKQFDPTHTGPVFDSSNSNFNRLSRIPHGTRGTVIQQLLLTGPLLPGEQLEELLQKYPQRKPLTIKTKLNRKTVNTLQEFENWINQDYTCPISIQKWSRPLSWMNGSNNRDKIFKECLYVYDLLNVSPDILLQYMTKHWSDAMEKTGYIRNLREVTHGSFTFHASKN